MAGGEVGSPGGLTPPSPCHVPLSALSSDMADLGLSSLHSTTRQHQRRTQELRHCWSSHSPTAAGTPPSGDAAAVTPPVVR